MNIIGSRLKELRQSKRLTLREVSDATGLSNSNISELETGEHGCTIGTLKILSDFYNVTTDYLIGTSNNPKATIIQVADSDGSITSIEYEIMDKIKGFTNEDMQKVLEYVDFIKSKSEVKKWKIEV